MLASMITNSAIMIAIVARSAAFTTPSMRRRIRTSSRLERQSAQRDHSVDDALVDTLAVFGPQRLAGALPHFHFGGGRLVDFHLLVDKLLAEFAFEFAVDVVCLFRRVGRGHKEFLTDRRRHRC